MNQHNMIKTAMIVPRVKLADPISNGQNALALIREAEKKHADIILFPELSLSGYSCGDLFLHSRLLTACEEALKELMLATKKTKTCIVIGLPVYDGQAVFNAAAVLQSGHLLGVVPKSCIANYGEFFESRWFCSAFEANKQTITLCGETVPFGQMIFKNAGTALGIEICEDFSVPYAPSVLLADQGAEIILNLSASSSVIGKRKYRKMLVQNHSFVSHCAYLYASSGPTESTTDVVYSGHVLAAENGTLLLDEQNLSLEDAIYYADIDLDRIRCDRMRMNTISKTKESKPLPVINMDAFTAQEFTLSRDISPLPFVPQDAQERETRFKEIYETIAIGLARRMQHINARAAVIGISGGLDSTLALLLVARAMDILNKPRTDILAVTMPGFGTTSRTLANAQKLMTLLGTTQQEISIRDACLQHFSDIGHDQAVTDVTYENTQARERTQILMDLANKNNGIVIGTGDLSELALGWATYAGDHISMYGVNAGVPKSLIRHLVDWIGKEIKDSEIQSVLADVLETPVSPELLPAKEGAIAQKTEEILGDYVLHDFFLYYFQRYGFTKEKILYLASVAFKDVYSTSAIEKAIALFFRRFFQNQFKRSCLPDGPKIGSVGLSPRTDLKMPSDASSAIWQ